MKKLSDLFNLNGKVSLGAMSMLSGAQKLGGASKPKRKDRTKVYGSKPKASTPKVPSSTIRQKDYLTLFQLMRDHRMLRLKVQGDTHLYQTVLLEVNAEDGYLVIDEPFPFDGVLSGNIRQNVVLEYEREGFTTVIRSVVEMRIEEEGDKYFRLEWPQVEELQRRDQYRLDVTRDWSNEIVITGIENQNVKAIIDLSSTGMRIAFEGNQVESIYAGTHLPNLCLQLQGCDPMKFSLDISHCHYVPDAELGSVQMTVAGGRFVGLSYRERQSIQRFIFAAQRSQRRTEIEEDDIAA